MVLNLYEVRFPLRGLLDNSATVDQVKQRVHMFDLKAIYHSENDQLTLNSQADTYRHTWFIENFTAGNTDVIASASLKEDMKCILKSWQPCSLILSVYLEHIYQVIGKCCNGLMERRKDDTSCYKHPVRVHIPSISHIVVIYSPSIIYLYSTSLFQSCTLKDPNTNSYKLSRGIPKNQDESNAATVGLVGGNGQECGKGKSLSSIFTHRETYNDVADDELQAKYTSDLDTLVKRIENHELKYVETSQVNHVLFTVHGVGYIGEKKCSSKNTMDLFKHLQYYERKDHDTFMVIPIQWRKDLVYNESQNLKLVDLAPTTRAGVSNTVWELLNDLLLYFDENTKLAIFKSIKGKLVAKYTKFLHRHGNSGIQHKFSIFSHSLGSVIMYDMMCDQNMAPEGSQEKKKQGDKDREHFRQTYLDINEETDTKDERHVKKKLKEYMDKLDKLKKKNPTSDDSLNSNYEQPNSGLKNSVHFKTCEWKLPFDVHALISCGSPLGAFLHNKYTRLSSVNTSDVGTAPLPKCKKWYNVFHPSDPVAYRLEPMIWNNFLKEAPMNIPCYVNGSDGLNVQNKFEADDMSFENSKDIFKDIDLQASTKIPSLDTIKQTLSEINPDNRLDWALQSSIFDVTFISLLTSHLRYYQNADFAIFLLEKLSL